MRLEWCGDVAAIVLHFYADFTTFLFFNSFNSVIKWDCPVFEERDVVEESWGLRERGSKWNKGKQTFLRVRS